MSTARTERPRNRRRALAAALVVIGVAGLGVASAARLNVTTSNLGAGAAVVGTCQGDAEINVAFTTELDDGVSACERSSSPAWSAPAART